MSTPKIDVAAGERTLYPVDELTKLSLTVFEDDSAGRALVRLEVPEITFSEEWEPATDLITGQAIAVRRADCGLGCKCAGEVKLVQA